MTVQSRNVVEALLAVLAIWLIVRTLPDYSLAVYVVLFQTDMTGQFDQLFGFQTARVITNVTLGVIFLWQRHRVSSWLTRSSEEFDVSATIVASLGTALLGIYFAAAGLINLGTYLLSSAEQQSMSRALPWGGAVSVTIGLVLFITSGRIARLWALLRR